MILVLMNIRVYAARKKISVFVDDLGFDADESVTIDRLELLGEE